ncbi:hypothetical protein F8566_07405 [Actinomadura rudentiformis]|uniref:DUF4232 domain-containing protein n=1 Tax=Actinomadura rudentiformis TaxID=359158 RepID=A0A6H9Z7D7_9ACTN|nr:hypothetical protein F8566_07405 [Actinomadura rudentiformis]
MIVLGAVLGTVGLGAWACTAGEGGQKQSVKNAVAAVGSGSPSAGAAISSLPAAAPTVTVTAKVTPETSKDGDACEKNDVVVNMTSARETYAKNEMPQFQLTVVNTGDHACTFDVGSKSLDVRVTSGGDRIWSVSACEQGGGSSIQMLRRGIPYVRTVTWDRKRADGRCRGKREAARPGTYVASVKADRIKVTRQVFRLR